MLRDKIEEVLMAACMKSRQAAVEITETLVSADFRCADTKKVYNIVSDMLNNGTWYSRVAIVSELEKGLVSKIFISNLLEKDVPSRGDLTYLIHQLKELSERDAISEYATKLKDAAGDSTHDLDRIRESLSQAIDIITPTTLKTGFSMTDVTAEIAEEMENPRGKVLSGILPLDTITGGFAKKEFGVLAALPGRGKTSLSLAISYNCAKNGVPVAYYGFEMSKAKMGEKLIAHHGNIPYFIMDKKPPQELKRWKDSIDAAMSEINDLPIYMCDESTVPNLDRLEESIRYMVSRHHVEMVVVDYLQQLSVPGIRDQFEAVTEVAKRLKKLAKLHNIFILAVSQMSREQAKDEERLPRSADLRSSGQIEQEAAYIMFIVRRQYSKEFKETGMRHKFFIPYYESSLYITKNRFSGEADLLCDNIAFIRPYAKYVNVVWDDTNFREMLCPKCQSPHVLYKAGKIRCSTCGLEETYINHDTRSGLVFKNRPIEMYGKTFVYDFAFLHDGYQGDSIAKQIKKINSLLPDQKPIRRLKMADTQPMDPITISDVVGDTYEF